MYLYTIHLSVEGHLVCFHFLAILDRLLMTVAEQVSVEQDVKPFEQYANLLLAL